MEDQVNSLALKFNGTMLNTRMTSNMQDFSSSGVKLFNRVNKWREFILLTHLSQSLGHH
jgi:hypothetical protein